MQALDRQAVSGFARDHGLCLVALFGSAARADREPEDLDLALLPEPGWAGSVLELARAMARHLARGDLDLAWLPSGGGLLWAEVARDGLPLFEARPGLFREFQNEALRRSWEGSLWTKRNRQFVQRLLEDRLDLNRDLLYQDLASLGEYLGKLEEVVSVPGEQFVSSFLHHHTAERLLQLMVECAAEINNEVGQAVARAPATDYYSSFFSLSAAAWISSELARELAELASLRNVLVHRYKQVTLDELHSTLRACLPHWRAYLEEVAGRLG